MSNAETKRTYRGSIVQQLRVWSVLATMAALATALTLGGARTAAGLAGLPRLLSTPTSSTAADLCLGLAGVGSVLGGAWLGLVTTVAALDHLRSRPPRPRSGALRPRLVQALVGATLTCVVAQPAVAAGPDASDHALPLPLRPVTAPAEAAHVETSPARTVPDHHGAGAPGRRAVDASPPSWWHPARTTPRSTAPGETSTPTTGSASATTPTCCTRAPP